MNKRLNNLWLKCGLATLVVLPVAASANLVTDGDFTGAGTPSGYATYFATSTMGGWTVTAGSVDLIGTYWQGPPTGGNSVDMAGDSSGTIQQTITGLDVGQQYDLSFYLSGNPDGAPTVKQLGVGLSIIGSTVDTFSYTIGSNSHGSMDYTLETETFTATGTSEVLQFQDQSSYAGTTPYGAVIGGVSLTPVPEPTTVVAGAMLLLPFGMSTLRMLRKSRAV